MKNWNFKNSIILNNLNLDITSKDLEEIIMKNWISSKNQRILIFDYGIEYDRLIANRNKKTYPLILERFGGYYYSPVFINSIL